MGKGNEGRTRKKRRKRGCWQGLKQGFFMRKESGEIADYSGRSSHC